MKDLVLALLGITLIVMVTLKSFGLLSYSWWTVTAPLWGSAIVGLLALAIGAVVYFAVGYLNKWRVK